MNTTRQEEGMHRWGDWLRENGPPVIREIPPGFMTHYPPPPDVVVDGVTYYMVGKCIGQRPGEITLINPANGQLATMPKRWLP